VAKGTRFADDSTSAARAIDDMREGVRNFSIGLVGLFGLLGLAALLLSFGEVSSTFERRYPVEVGLNATGGLRQGSLVTLYGVPIGLVDRIALDSSDAERPVRVRTVIDRSARIPDPARPTVEASLLGSGARLELSAGLGAPTRWHKPGAVPLLLGDYRPLEDRLLAALDERLGDVRGALDGFREFTATYAELGRNLNDLVRPLEDGATDPAGSVRTMIVRANAAIATADEALRLARDWLGEEALRADVRGAVAKANELIERSTDTVNVIAGLAANLDADREALVRRLLPVFDEASLALGEVRRVIALAGQGQGTVGRLLNDPRLYEDLADSAKRLSRVMEAIQAVAEKLRAEGIVIQF
jgi:phospholipid/cholesterol/gamma-HCH transport system substrate-binding protein